jgi:hypothetical protein
MHFYVLPVNIVFYIKKKTKQFAAIIIIFLI